LTQVIHSLFVVRILQHIRPKVGHLRCRNRRVQSDTMLMTLKLSAR
jgi:hypothetical protein